MLAMKRLVQGEIVRVDSRLLSAAVIDDSCDIWYIVQRLKHIMEIRF